MQRRECRRKKNAPSFATFCHITRRNPRDVSPRRWRLFLFFLSLPSVFSVPGAVQCHRSRGLRPTAFCETGTIFKYDAKPFVFDVKPNASPKLPLLKNIEGIVPEALLVVRLRDRGVARRPFRRLSRRGGRLRLGRRARLWQPLDFSTSSGERTDVEGEGCALAVHLALVGAATTRAISRRERLHTRKRALSYWSWRGWVRATSSNKTAVKGHVTGDVIGE